MKEVPCAGPNCADRRIHWERPYEPRGTQMVKVPDDYEGKAYCSLECAIYGGDLTFGGKPA